MTSEGIDPLSNTPSDEVRCPQCAGGGILWDDMGARCPTCKGAGRIKRVAEPRPKWTEAIRHFVGDEVIDDKYEYPEDGSADDLSDEVETAVNAIFCRVYGHDIVDDQCMIPEHRFCVYCGRRASAL